jgi:soluble lytic murein transglycosylase-like protein
MKKVLFNTIILCLLAASVSAQSRTKVFDNFDTGRGVQIVTPTIAPVGAETKNKKLVKKTAQVARKSQNAADGLSLRQPVAYARLSMAAGNSMGAFTTGDATIDSYITNSSIRYNIDPLLIYAQMHQESGFKLKATSYKGARGLMQLMPGTAIRFGVTDIYNPKQNIEAGVKYMRWLLDKFGDVSLALAGYNAGEGAVMKYGNQIPPYRETQEYVRRIGLRYNSITNPNLARVARRVSDQQAVKLEQKEAAPLTVLERSALAIRTADGKMRLVNQ